MVFNFDVELVEGWHGVFGNGRRLLAARLIRELGEVGAVPLVVDTHGFFAQVLEEGVVLRLGVDVSLDVFRIAGDGSEDSIVRLAEVLQAAFDIDDSEQMWVLEGLRVMYSESGRAGFSELIGWLMEAKAMSSVAEGYRLEALISKLYMATAGSNIVALENRLGESLWDVEFQGLTIIDLSPLSGLKARGAAQILVPIVLALRDGLPENLYLFIDSANLGLPERRKYTRYELSLRSARVSTLLEHLDVLKERGATAGFSAPSASMIDQDLVRLLETLILLEPSFVRDADLIRRISGGRLEEKPPWANCLLTSSNGAVWMAIDLKETHIYAEPILDSGGSGVRPLRPATLLEAVFHEHAKVVARFIEALRLSFMTRGEAVLWFKRERVGEEEADFLVNRMMGLGLIREMLSAGRRILVPTMKGLRAYEEARLRGVLR